MYSKSMEALGRFLVNGAVPDFTRTIRYRLCKYTGNWKSTETIPPERSRVRLLGIHTD
jgi:hypothetical protein